MKKQNPRHIVEQLILRLGFPYSSRGTGCFIDATLLCSMNPQVLTAVTKEVYPYVAKLSSTNWRNVEHNMRTVRDKVWQNGNRALLDEMAGFPLVSSPSVGEILNYITGYIRDHGLLSEYYFDE